MAEKIKENLKSFQLYYSPEKVYLHHDKPYYMAGELLWLKAYVVDAASLQSTNRSGVLYVDLIDSSNQTIERLTLPIEEGQAFGDISLPDNLDEGIYRLSAFTSWMRNFGEETFFQKDIYILGSKEDPRPKSTGSNAGFDLQFFPEGGDLIQGLHQELAFKALDSNGYGISFSASVIDDTGNEILDIKDQHAGMGSFSFTPEPDKQYFVKLDQEDGSDAEFPLPIAKKRGYILSVDEVSDPENILLRVATNIEEQRPLHIFGISQDQLRYDEAVLTPASKTFESKVPKSDFPTGVVRFTLALEDGEPLAERLVFVRHPKKNNLKVISEKDAYFTREEVKLSIQSEGEAEISHISVSVTANTLVNQPKHQENIETYLLMSSDLKGYVEDPGYYFENRETEKQSALRTLMMTQGWRRFGWDDLVSDRFPIIRFQNERDLNIRGRLVDNKGNPISEGEALLYLKDKYTTFMIAPTDDKGYFTFKGFYFKGNIPVVVQGTDKRGRRDNVEVQMLGMDDIQPRIDKGISLSPQFIQALPDHYISYTQEQFQSIETEVWGMELDDLLLQEVVVEGRAEVFKPFKLHTRADAVIYQSQLPVAPSGNVLEVLQGRVAGLQVMPDGMNQFRAVIRGQGPPLYLWDGIPIGESTLQSINQFDIERIEILKGPGSAGIYGGRAGNGVIAFFSKSGLDEEEVDLESGKHITLHHAAGFNRTRQFYSPVYETSEYYDLPDLRSTIYWNPTVPIMKNSVRELRFFTSDTPGTYQVTIEGLTDSGEPLYQSFTLDVGNDTLEEN